MRRLVCKNLWGRNMVTTMKKVLLGMLLGAAIAFPLGANYGRNAPWLSNPFAERRLGDTVKVKAEHLIDNTKGAIHEATRPEQKR